MSNFIISYPRSGRAWTLTICAELRKWLGRGFRVSHSHDCAAVHAFRRYRPEKDIWAGHRIVLVTRDPRDVVVSYWHILSHRSKRHILARRLGLFEWAKSKYGLPFVLRFLNDWGDAIEAGVVESPTIVSYEDLKADPREGIIKIAMGFGASRERVEQVVDGVVCASTFEAVRARFAHSNTGDDERAFSARRGESGVWREYFSVDEQYWIDSFVSQNLRHFEAYR